MKSLFFLLSSIGIVWAQSLMLPSIFSDNMIIQRGIQAPVWGISKPGSEIKIVVDNQQVKCISDANGSWKVFLPYLSTGQTYSVIITSGSDKVEFKNVVVGDVYYAGGQSNMQFALSESTGGETEIANADYKNIRLFTVPRDISFQPKFDINQKSKEQSFHGQWVTCTPATAKDFSGVAYYFAKKIHQNENIPIGIINVSWGGTPIEAHMSWEANASLPYFKNTLAEIRIKKSSDTIKINRKTEVPQVPSCIFNAMIHPLIPFGIKGFIWYQAEQNWANPFRYRFQFKTFIQDLRQRWQLGYLPFYYVQLPGMGKKPAQPMEDFWSVIRESQNESLTLPNVHTVVTLDLGESDIHPKNKKSPGERLADLALKYQYNKPTLPQCPVFESFATKLDTIELSFKYAQQGLMFRNDTVKGFAIAGDDHQFVWANAIIKENKVLVFSPKVKQPFSVRYAWGEDPPISLFTKIGLPVSPFRTDTWYVREDGKW
ncbi:MAG: sialate O-acetylesterase [Bacteroidota bacterium]|nr:sialate O-acetylesterase [Bacteroidota bacterium]